jgi:DNA-binding HxlR family transcriptional regulator
MSNRTLEKLIASQGSPKVLITLLQKGPAYQSELSFETRLHGITISRTLDGLINMKMVRRIPPVRKVIHVEDFYELTSYGKDVAKLLLDCQTKMTHSFEKIIREHHIE